MLVTSLIALAATIHIQNIASGKEYELSQKVHGGGTSLGDW